MDGKSVPAEGRRRLLLAAGLPGCPHHMVAGFPRASDPRGSEVETMMSFLTLEVTHCDLDTILLVMQIVEEGTVKGVRTRRQELLECHLGG